MLTGIEEVDWASLGHAYGPADDVPELLRGLASDDPAERENALDGMYGAVHHQGDVYDSTLACIPFLLELVADPTVQDRGGIVELLTSIGGIDLCGDEELDELDPDDEEFIPAANYAMAAAAIAAGADVFLALVDDPDPEVRLAAPCALASLHCDPVRVLDLLRERLTVEQDTEVRLALVAAVGRIALRHESLRDETVDWLGWLSRAAQAPGLRLAALAQLARVAPAEIPEDVVERVTVLLDEVRAAPPGPSDASVDAFGSLDSLGSLGSLDPLNSVAGAAGAADAGGVEGIGRIDGAGGTGGADGVDGVDSLDGAAAGCTAAASASALMGQVRELFEEHSVGRPTPWTEELLRTLHSALDDRVDDRIALILAQLRSPDWGQRSDAIWLCGGLIRVWRGRYEEVVRLVGAQLSDPEPRLREAATSFLERLFELGGPAADALAMRLATGSPGPLGLPGPGARAGRGGALLALARCGDARAIPLLARALEEREVRRELLYAVDSLGPAAQPLAPVLRRRLGEVELDDLLYDRAAPLLFALGSVRGAQALPEVLRVLRGAPVNRREWVREACLRTLAAFGPAAREALPDVRRLLDSESAAVSSMAARAMWALDGSLDEALGALDRWLRPGTSGGEWCAAALALGAIGPAAARSAPALRAGLGARDLWVRVRSAAALWRVAGDAAETLPVLLAGWEENRHTRVAVAECLAEMGPAAAAAEPAIRAELSRRRRHNAREDGAGSHDVHDDEKLLTLCRAALTQMERRMY
ncbi:HEAT repeat domain-containing protein [Streptomyces sp. NPDC101115]|uniref:HEAT repeat domain-containing protein n=1 Tax=Streptomyces sp. NPDC101115 TaxID=3366106 RepID=UPI0038040983